MRSADEERILQELLACLERGQDPDVSALLARHPGQEQAVRMLVRAARTYARSTRELAERMGAAARMSAGSRLGDFEIVRLLARGGSGEVYVARQRSLGGREVALKVVRAPQDDGTARGRFEREAMLAAALHHPSLAEVYGFGAEGSTWFLAMQRVLGPTLESVLRRLPGRDTALGAARLRRLVQWAAQIASALAALHERGLIHRDVKPSNVLVEDEGEGPAGLPGGRAVLVDFGLVRPLGAGTLTATGHAAATLAYAPTEQLLGREVTARADVFALGATLHDLLARRAPGERPQASIGLEPLRELVEEVDPDLEAIVAKAVDPQPRWRYAHAGELLADLEAWLDGREVSARRLARLERARRWVRHNPRRVAGGVLIGLLLLLSSALLARFDHYGDLSARAQESYRSGDVLELRRAVLALPPWLDRWLLPGGGMVRSAEALRGRAEGGRLLPVALRLEDDDLGGAMLEAVSHMRLYGVGSEPALQRFVVAQLDAVAASPRAAEARERAAVVRSVARLFYERPDRSPDDVEASVALRATLARIFLSRDVDQQTRWLSLTALSGCGTGAELPGIIAWSMEQVPESEDRRLGLLCAVRVLERLSVCGGAGSVDLGALASELEPEALRVLGSLEARPVSQSSVYQAPWAVLRLVTQLALSQRLFEGGSALGRLLDGHWPDPFESEVPRAWAHLELRGAAGDRRVAEEYRARRGDGGFVPGGQGYYWGLCVGLLDDPLLLALVQQDLHVDDGPERRSPYAGEFQRGLDEARARLSGRMPSHLDADTLLGASSAPLEFAALPAERGEQERDASHAGWRFSEPTPQLLGAAAGVRAQGCTREFSERRHYLRMFDFGRSEVRLAFTLGGEAPGGTWTLELEHLAARRELYPFGGEAWFSILVDDQLLSTARILEANVHRSSFEVPGELMTPGAHELVVRCERATTTTYRLYGAHLLAPR